jgi:hypothetical protein
MGKPPRFFIIGTKYGRTRDMLPSMLENGVISTGFADDLDLSDLVGQGLEHTRKALDQVAEGETSASKNTLARFLNLRPGDIIALKSHSAPIKDKPRLVIARYAVVSGTTKAKYRFIVDLGHSLDVDFLGEQEPIEFAYGYGKTLHDVIQLERVTSIFGPFRAVAEIKSPTKNGSLSLDNRITHQSMVAGRGGYIMKRVHNELQNFLRDQLVNQFGEYAVSQEENYVDLRVSLPDKLILIEVKSSMSPITCIREALGQLLHYAYRSQPSSGQIEYIVAGPSATTDETTKLLDFIKSMTNLIIEYRFVDLNNQNKCRATSNIASLSNGQSNSNSRSPIFRASSTPGNWAPKLSPRPLMFTRLDSTLNVQPAIVAGTQRMPRIVQLSRQLKISGLVETLLVRRMRSTLPSSARKRSSHQTFLANTGEDTLRIRPVDKLLQITYKFI